MTKLKTQILKKLKNSHFDETEEKKNCDNIKKTQIVTKLKNSNCDKTQKIKL